MQFNIDTYIILNKLNFEKGLALKTKVEGIYQRVKLLPIQFQSQFLRLMLIKNPILQSTLKQKGLMLKSINLKIWLQIYPS
jgi:hypothetical protein